MISLGCFCFCQCSAGVVLAFFSNQQTYDSVGNAQGILNDVFDHARDYVNGAIDVSY